VGEEGVVTGDPRGAAGAARPLVTILAPAFNEADIVERNLARIVGHMRGLEDRWRWELIVVDDGSTDGTSERVTAAAAGAGEIRLHRHPMNLGLGQALRSGFRLARGDVIVVLDLDLTYDPGHVDLLLQRQRETGAEMVLASPYMKGGRATRVPWLRRVLSRWGNRFLALTARGGNPAGNLSTLTGMVRAYDAGFIRSLNLTSTGMEINTEIIYKGMLLDARIEEVPAHLDWSARRPTLSLSASGRRIRRGVTFSLMAGFTIRPFAFFIIPAAILGIVSLYMLSWIGVHVAGYYREIGPVPGGVFDDRFSEAVARAFQRAPHSFFVAGVTLLLAVQLASLGVLALQAKHYFEELFHLGTRLVALAQNLERRRDPSDPT
jgi:glycosyltransferase involved in cell wall biosynthesis